MKDFMNWFANEESGQGMVEYGLIIALVSIVVILVLTNMGESLKKLFENTNNTLVKQSKIPTE